MQQVFCYQKSISKSCQSGAWKNEKIWMLTLSHEIWTKSYPWKTCCQVCILFFNFQKVGDFFQIFVAFSEHLLAQNAITELANHVKVVHEKMRRFECSHCHMKFGQKATLEKHVARFVFYILIFKKFAWWRFELKNVLRRPQKFEKKSPTLFWSY